MTAEITTPLPAQVSDAELLNHLDNLGLTDKLTKGEKNTFLQIAKAFNLNPFKREVHVSKYGDTMSIIVGYEVYIKRAERTGLLDGWEVSTTGSVAGKDLKAHLTIYRKDRAHPFKWEASYMEFVQYNRDGKVTKFWEKAEFMIKKVAISQGFRLCFSDELGGMPYTKEEMPDTLDTTYDEVKAPNNHAPENAQPIEPDFEDALRSCDNLAQLQRMWSQIPKDRKTEFEPLKNEIKAKLSSEKDKKPAGV